MSRPVILTGLRANNDLHIGNYFGALLPIIDMATTKSSDYQVNLFVPDLHSFTTPIDHSQLQEQIMHNLRLFAAAGLPLDNPNIHIYRQSYIPAHSELAWIFNCFTSFGQMSRMTQFKDKSGIQDLMTRLEDQLNVIQEHVHELNKIEEFEKKIDKANDIIQSDMDFKLELLNDARKGASASVGLFDYPVLMAADILLYDAKYVPVGDDQTQHLEFARDIAEWMNSKFGELFTVPEPVKKQHELFGKDQGLRIKDLQNPGRKMSKSETSDKGVIFLGDNPEDAAKKIMSAETDSVGVVNYDAEKQPGISNLLQIHALLTGEPLETIIAKYEGSERYGDLKKDVAAQVQQFLTNFQQRLAGVNDGQLIAKLQSDEAQMRDTANAKLLAVQEAVGLR